MPVDKTKFKKKYIKKLKNIKPILPLMLFIQKFNSIKFIHSVFFFVYKIENHLSIIFEALNENESMKGQSLKIRFSLFILNIF